MPEGAFLFIVSTLSRGSAARLQNRNQRTLSAAVYPELVEGVEGFPFTLRHYFARDRGLTKSPRFNVGAYQPISCVRSLL